MEPHSSPNGQTVPTRDLSLALAHQNDSGLASHHRLDAHSSTVALDVDNDNSVNSDAEADPDDTEDEDADACDEGVPSLSTTSTAVAAAAATTQPIQYDPHDHTMAAPPGSKVKNRVWVLPRTLLPPTSPGASPLGSSGSSSALFSSFSPSTSSVHAAFCSRTGMRFIDDDNDGCSTRTSTQSASAAAGRASVPLAAAASAGEGSNRDGDAAPQSLPVRVVRLPHPRHGQPALYLVRTAASAPPAPASDAASSLLFEIQAQAPPNDFAQSWFVQERVIPSSLHNGEMLVVTPVNLTYFALHALFAEAATYEHLSRQFMSASDLYRDGEGDRFSAAPSQLASRQSREQRQDGEEEKDTSADPAEKYVSVFSGVGGDDDDAESSQSSRSTPCSFASPSLSTHHHMHSASEGNTCRPVTDAAAPAKTGWPGWAQAALQHPLTFCNCFTVLQSDTVLRRLCEVREVPATHHHYHNNSSDQEVEGACEVYYRPAEAVAVAWLKRKVERLRASAVLREVLQLPEAVPQTLAVEGASTQEQQQQQEQHRGTGAEVPMAIAFGIVAEYVPERLQGPLAVACGLPDPTHPLSSSSSLAGVKRGRDGECWSGGSYSPAETKPSAAVSASATLPVAGPKSASVKRLEKAGRPKGTPTLFTMFAKKKKNVE